MQQFACFSPVDRDLGIATRLPWVKQEMITSFSPVDRDLGIATPSNVNSGQTVNLFQSRRPGFGDCDDAKQQVDSTGFRVSVP